MNTKRVHPIAVLVAAASSAAQPQLGAEEPSPTELPAPAGGQGHASGPLAEAGRRPSRKRERRELLERPETLEAVCELFIEGNSLRSIAANRELFPMEISASLLLRWLTDDPARLQQYARAREAAADFLAEEIIAIADDQTADPNCRRVRIDARKWYAGKLRPKVYGDRIQQEHTGTLTIEDALRQLPAVTG